MTERVYLDWNATAPLHPAARHAMTSALDVCGNASSVHTEGRAARRIVEDAREKVARLVGAEPRNVVFTSGGTEANILALSPGIGAGRAQAPRDALLVSAIEHPSVLSGGRFRKEAVERIPVSPDGRLDLAALKDLLGALHKAGRERPLVSVMAANNETGVVQPVAEAARVVHEAGGLLHVDAIQTAGRIPCDINALGADLVTLSAHKMGGPKGAGALVRRADLHIEPLVTGGGQERGQRAGTENVPAVAGFGAAAALASERLAADTARMRDLRDRLEAGILAATSAAIVFGAGVERLPNTTLVALAGLKAETAVIAFDLDGIAVSSGAACSSGKVQPSHVLAAMGVTPDLARAAVRLSLGATTTEAEVDRFIGAWIKVSGALLNRSQGIAA
ncbi:MAG: cysteine desulfurase family protein [Xanthobacteraceae bacterium]